MLSLVLTSLLLGSALAVPRELQPRACNRDNCYRDIFGTAIASQSSQGVLECSRLMTKVVTPCAITSTSRIPTVVVASNVYSIQTITVTSVTLSTDISTVSDTATSIFTELSTVLTTSVVTLTSTSTAISSATVTSVQGSNRIFKREEEDVLVNLKKRSTTTAAQCPATSSVTTIPARYSADCANLSRYSSACSCFGISAGTQTLSPLTVVVSTIVTSTSTPVVPTTTVVTVTVGLITQATTTNTAQSSSTVTSITMSVVTSTTTSTTTVTSTSTSTVVLPPFPTTFVIQADSAPGTYIQVESGRYTGLTQAVTNLATEQIPLSTAPLFTIINNHLWLVDQSAAFWSPTDGGIISVIAPDSTAEQRFYQLMTVAVGAYDSAVTNGYPLTFYNSANSFTNSPGAPYLQVLKGDGDLAFNYRKSPDYYNDPPPFYAVRP